jgi:hypothetical protein
LGNKYPCPCCGYLTLAQEPPGTFLLCPVCFWEDDSVQFKDPNYTGGANHPSLNQARKNFRTFGASEEMFIDKVRPPLPSEIPE